MAIDFEPQKYEQIKEDSKRWWAGELNRPIIQIRLRPSDLTGPKPKLPQYDYWNFFASNQPELFDFEVKAEDIIERWAYYLGNTRFLGDAYPLVWPNFGPGVLAAFLGLELKRSAESVWYDHDSRAPIEQMQFSFDPNNQWFKRIRDIKEAAVNRWGGSVGVVLTDMGGPVDILSSFRGPEQLMYDMYDHPDHVQRLIGELHDCWMKYYGEFCQVIDCEQNGYITWPCVWSDKPYYILQCDFAYMLSPDLFNTFVYPEIKDSIQKLPNSIYHLDGTGQLAHLDTLLANPNLKGVEWVPGAGQPDVGYWPQVYRKIQDAGKLNHIFDVQYEGDCLKLPDVIHRQLGSLKGFAFILSGDISQEKPAMELLERHHVPV